MLYNLATQYISTKGSLQLYNISKAISSNLNRFGAFIRQHILSSVSVQISITVGVLSLTLWSRSKQQY